MIGKNKNNSGSINKFGMRIRQLRLERHITSQAAFARNSGIDERYIGGIERGERNPSLLTIANSLLNQKTYISAPKSETLNQTKSSTSQNSSVFQASNSPTIRGIIKKER